MLLVIIALIALVLLVGFGVWQNAQLLPVAESDPLKELEAAHKIELAEWDREFETKGPTPVRYLLDPTLAQRERDLSAAQQNSVYVPGLRGLFAAVQGSQQYSSVQQECELAEQQSLQRQAMLAAMAQMNHQTNLAQDAFSQMLGGLNGRRH